MFDIQNPDWLDHAMLEADVRTGALSAASGVSRSQIQRIRNGCPPRLDTLRALQAALTELKSRPSEEPDPQPVLCADPGCNLRCDAPEARACTFTGCPRRVEEAA